MEEKVLTALATSIGVSVPLGLFAWAFKNYIKVVTAPIQEALQRLRDIEQTYPKCFVNKDESDKTFHDHEQRLRNHESRIIILENKK